MVSFRSRARFIFGVDSFSAYFLVFPTFLRLKGRPGQSNHLGCFWAGHVLEISAQSMFLNIAFWKSQSFCSGCLKGNYGGTYFSGEPHQVAGRWIPVGLRHFYEENGDAPMILRTHFEVGQDKAKTAPRSFPKKKGPFGFRKFGWEV